MARKLLFLVFTNDPCRRNHAFMYALDLHRQGHETKIILEGEGTQSLRDRTGRFGELFAEAVEANVLVGACKTASGGCASDDPARSVAALAETAGLPLLDTMGGHAGIGPFVKDGYEIVTF